MTINLKNKASIVKKYGKDANDTGSASVQIAMMSQKSGKALLIGF